jgi:CRP-like cAMP-binding protein
MTMQPEARSGRVDAVRAHPLADLLACPSSTWNLLHGAARCIDFDAGEIVFRQSAICLGLYIVVSGQFLCRTERLERRLTLGTVRAGGLVELAAALEDGHHTYTLSAQTSGSALLFPITALKLAFESYPPLRMRLLEELAHEVSRSYETCCLTRTARTRRGSS